MNLNKYFIGYTMVVGLIFTLFIVGCGKGEDKTQLIPGPVGEAGSNGVNGEQGIAGNSGSNGVNGFNSLITTVTATVSQCSTGGIVILTGLDTNRDNVLAGNEITGSATVCNGAKGSTGATGATGQTGQTGATGATGVAGQQGVSGATTPFTIVNIIQPCGAASSPYKEVLLCLNDGSILASFSDTSSGNETRFAFIPSGSYIDTDDSNCSFSVSVDSINNSVVSWSSGSDQYSTYKAGSVLCAAH